MPKSKVRKKTVSVATSTKTLAPTGRAVRPSPTWYPIAVAAVLLIGLAYIVVWYLAPSNSLMNGLGSWNLAVGFGILVVGLVMTLRWR